MSSFNDDQVMCPRCGMTPVLASDTGPFYLYICTNKECPFETKNYEELVLIDATASRREAQPSPPPDLPRPDVEGILNNTNYRMSELRKKEIFGLCDYALALEKRLEAVTTERKNLTSIEVGASFARFDELNTANSLLAALVKAGKKYRWSHWQWCGKSKDLQAGCTCGYDDITAAFEAAKAVLEGEKGKNNEAI